MQIIASVLGADYAKLADELQDLASAGVDAVQWDVMDGHFVPNLTFGADVVRACRGVIDLPFEAHLMIEEPERWFGAYVEAGCQTVIPHAETTDDLPGLLVAIRDAGAKAGVALNPETGLDALDGAVDLIDLLVVMTVHPGFGGQGYLAEMESKITAARRLLDAAGNPAPIEVDGGIKAHNIARAAAAGAEHFISGSGILGHPDGKAAAVAELRAALA
jgi:ribulose-phosphate 3-epimerase